MDKLCLKEENIVAKGEIACFEQFLLLSLFFIKPSAADASKSVYMRERDNYPFTGYNIVFRFVCFENI